MGFGASGVGPCVFFWVGAPYINIKELHWGKNGALNAYPVIDMGHVMSGQ